jgi:RNA polymerase sigma-70 factor (ECF subfamily)
MRPQVATERLSEITTRWSLIFLANDGRRTSAQAAQQALVERYGGAIYRYMLCVVKKHDVVDDLCQEFAVRLVRGDFSKANPEKGRFRDFLKTCLFHLVADFHRKKSNRPGKALEEVPEIADSGNSDEEFNRQWREEVLEKVWEMLQTWEQNTGQLFYTVLRTRAEAPELRSPMLAQKLSEKLNKPFTPDNVRQTLHRARNKFADLLREEIGRTIQTDDPLAIEDELRELGLLAYCQPGSGSSAG